MKAAIFKQYGTPDVITIEEVPIPTINQEQILIKVLASTINSGDARLRRADPWMVRLVFGLTKPRKSKQILGVVYAGIVQEVGQNVTNVKVGTRIYGLSDNFMGGHAEYAKINSKDAFGLIPDKMSCEDAAAIAFGGTTAIHFLRDIELKDKTVIINGGSGSVGTSILQIATARGAKVTTITSAKNIELMKTLGAANTIDYRIPDNIMSQEYDIVIDCMNNIPIPQLTSMVKKDGNIFLIAGLVKEILSSKKIKKAKVKVGPAQIKDNDYEELNSYYLEGQLKPVISYSFGLDEIVIGHVVVDSGHKVGNIVIKV